jgi:hypothetical protein
VTVHHPVNLFPFRILFPDRRLYPIRPDRGQVQNIPSLAMNGKHKHNTYRVANEGRPPPLEVEKPREDEGLVSQPSKSKSCVPVTSSIRPLRLTLILEQQPSKAILLNTSANLLSNSAIPAGLRWVGDLVNYQANPSSSPSSPSHSSSVRSSGSESRKSSAVHCVSRSF